MALGGSILTSALALILWWKVPPAVPVLESVTQLTDDGEPKPGRLATDGPRIYFNEGGAGSFRLAQVAVTGGPISDIPTRVANPRIAGLTLEGSTLLVVAETGNSTVYPEALWTISLPAGEPRRVGTIEATDANFSPDGNVVFTYGNDAYITGRDGSNPRKLLSMTARNRVGLTEPTVSPDGRRLAFTGDLTWGTSSPFRSQLGWHRPLEGVEPC
jgi:hypothetical protein